MNFYQPLSQFESILYNNTIIDLKLSLYIHFFLKFFQNLNIDGFFDLLFWDNFMIFFKNSNLIAYFTSIFCFVSNIVLYFFILFLDIIYMKPFLDNSLNDHSVLRNFIYEPENDFILVEEFWIDISINKFYTTIFFVLFYLLIFLVFCFKNFKFYKNTWNIVIFSFIENFLSETIIQQLGIKKGQKYSVFLKSFFLLILFSNIFGLIPFSFTITSHLIFTFSLSFAILLGITFLGFYLQGMSFLNLLVPGGAPKFLLPLLIPIEFISYVARCFSLAIRLFANMMSGHTLLNILSGFILKIAKNGFLFFSLAPLLVVLAVFILELGIAFLQAYVFLVLVCIYLKDGFQASH